MRPFLPVLNRNAFCSDQCTKKNGSRCTWAPLKLRINFTYTLHRNIWGWHAIVQWNYQIALTAAHCIRFTIGNVPQAKKDPSTIACTVPGTHCNYFDKKYVKRTEWRYRCELTSASFVQTLWLNRCDCMNEISSISMGLPQPQPLPKQQQQQHTYIAHTLLRRAICRKPTPFSFSECAPCATCMYLHVSVCDSLAFDPIRLCCDIGFFVVENARNHTNSIRTETRARRIKRSTQNRLHRTAKWFLSASTPAASAEEHSKQEHHNRVSCARSFSFIRFGVCSVQNRSPSQWKIRCNESDGNQENVVAVVDREGRK